LVCLFKLKIYETPKSYMSLRLLCRSSSSSNSVSSSVEHHNIDNNEHETLCQQIRAEFKEGGFFIEPDGRGVNLYLPVAYFPLPWLDPTGSLEISCSKGESQDTWQYRSPDHADHDHTKDMDSNISVTWFKTSDATHSGFYKWEFSSLAIESLEAAVKEVLNGFQVWQRFATPESKAHGDIRSLLGLK